LFDWSGKLFDLVLHGLASAAGTMGVELEKKRLLARISDFNPYHFISTNHDLTRAVRLAWVEAALEILKSDEESVETWDRLDQRNEVLRFNELALKQLKAVRSHAFDKRLHPGDSPIDSAVRYVVEGAPEFNGFARDSSGEQQVTGHFVETLAALTGWPSHEVPPILGQIATQGLPTYGGGPRRSFGELVFAAFAELIKSPDKYPEAQAAFHIEMEAAAKKLSTAILASVHGIDKKLDDLIARIDPLVAIQSGAAGYLKLLPKIAEDVGVIRKEQDKESGRAEARHRELMETQKEGQRRLERLMIDAAGGGAKAVVAIAGIRDLLRPGNPEIDDIDAEKLPSLLKRIIEDLQKPGAVASDFSGAVKWALTEAQARTAELKFAEAAQVLDVALAQVEAEDQDRARGRAALLAERGHVARLQLRYREAAVFYEKAADAVNFDAVLIRSNRFAAAGALLAEGVEFGDNQALHEAADIYRALLRDTSRQDVPLSWAVTQNNLGVVLTTLGERESGTARLDQAVVAYREALQEYTRDRVPLNWAATQHNLGRVLTTLGGREWGSEQLEEAVASYREALKELARERVPLKWAATQHSLGNVLAMLGTRESGTARLDQAIVAYREALKERTRELVPRQWAITQIDLATALYRLAWQEGWIVRHHQAMATYLKVRLDQAVEACREALKEFTRERVPLPWAAAQNHLGNALALLGVRESGTERLDQAVAAYREALKESRRELMPLEWARNYGSEGVALMLISSRRGDLAMAERALAQIAAAHETARDGGHVVLAAYFEKRIAEAQVLVERLRGLDSSRG